MAQKINPTALRLTVIQNWRTIGKTKFIEIDNFIRNLTRGYLIKKGYLSSEIIIKKTSKILNLTFIVYPNKPTKEISYCIEFLKLILMKFFPKYLITFHIRVINSLTKNAKILSEWLKLEIYKKPKGYSSILKKLFLDLKRLRKFKRNKKFSKNNKFNNKNFKNFIKKH